MKRILMITLLALCASALVFAQGARGQAPDTEKVMRRTQAVPSSEKLTITGNLTIVNGMIAVKKDDASFLLPGLLRYAGFIDGIKDGAQVTVEGLARSQQADSKTKVLLIQKLTIGNREYEMAPPLPAGKTGQNREGPMMQRQGGRNFSRTKGTGCSCQNGPQQFHRHGPGK